MRVSGRDVRRQRRRAPRRVARDVARPRRREVVQQRLRPQSFRRRRVAEVLLVRRVQHIGTGAAPHAIIEYFIGFPLHVLGRLAARRE